MSVQVVWDDAQQTIIRYIFDGAWTWNEVAQGIAVSNAWLEAAPGRTIDFIYDLRASQGLPDGALAFLRKYVNKVHEGTGRQVVVGTSKSTMVMITRRLLDMIQAIYHPPWNLRFAHTLEEAHALLGKPVPSDTK